VIAFDKQGFFRKATCRGICVRVAALVCIAWGVWLVAPARAQHVASTVDAQVVRLRYSDTTQATAIGLSPVLVLAWPRATVNVAGNVSQLGSSWSTNGTLDGSVFTPSRGPFTGEFEASLGGSAHQDGTHTGTMLGLVRLHAMATSSGLWIGAGGGQTWDGEVWRAVRQGEAGVWFSKMPFSALLVAAPTVVDDSIRYTDIGLDARWTQSRLEVGVSSGLRSGAHLPTFGTSPSQWGSVSATVWMMAHMAVVGSAGTYPVDYTQGFPGGRFVSLAFRFSVQPHTIGRNDRSINVPRADTTIVRFLVTTVQGHQRLIRVFSPTAHSVELNGDFSAWQSVSLVRNTDGWWSVVLSIPPGSYQVNLRVDHERWVVPPGLPRVTDEFGGVTGILVVP
jgi:hypothetical protein